MRHCRLHPRTGRRVRSRAGRARPSACRWRIEITHARKLGNAWVPQKSRALAPNNYLAGGDKKTSPQKNRRKPRLDRHAGLLRDFHHINPCRGDLYAICTALKDAANSCVRKASMPENNRGARIVYNCCFRSFLTACRREIVLLSPLAARKPNVVPWTTYRPLTVYGGTTHRTALPQA